MTSLSPLSHEIWDLKYRLKDEAGQPLEASIEDSWRRVAKALAVAEKPEAQAAWEEQFYQALEDFKFLPAGRILAGAGTQRDVTLFNCFVMGTIPDDMNGIFDHLREAALTLQQGGGIGYDFSSLRPKGALVQGIGAEASGPVSFMEVWDAMCRTIMSAGARRGAMMATLACDHPDIETFIAAKSEAGRLTNFNLSVLVSDAFLEAVEKNQPWPLVFAGETYRVVEATELWQTIMRATYESAEPGVIFIDRINHANNLHYCETIRATNPCGEQPLPPYGACLLGSINLSALVRNPFAEDAHLDSDALQDLVTVALRMLDNAIDVSRFPLDAQRQEARAKRRVGLGVTGLADALACCRLRYGTPEAADLAGQWMEQIKLQAYQASVDLAVEKGAFDLFEAEAFLTAPLPATLPEDLRSDIAAKGLRNGLLTSIAPTGTISLLAGNISSGLEPIFAFEQERSLLGAQGERVERRIDNPAYRLYRSLYGESGELPDYLVEASALTPEGHLRMQSAIQAHVDAAVSKTINLPGDIAFEDFQSVYLRARELGCKGCTTYRPNALRGSVLKPARSEVRAAGGQVVHLSEPLSRPEALVGRTYKLRWPESDHALYITINDLQEEGRLRPFEIFINSKNMEHYAWTLALTRMISAVFRRGGDVSFVVEELKAVFDPRGGAWLEGRYVPSLLAAIGGVIEAHMIETGFLAPGEQGVRAASRAGSGFGDCPRCGERALLRQEGCDLCTSCHYSRCA